MAPVRLAHPGKTRPSTCPSCAPFVCGSRRRSRGWVPVPLLHETEPGLVPDEPVHHQFLQRGVYVALAFEQFIPNRHAAIRIAHDAHRTSDPMVNAKRIVALKQARIAPLVPAEQSSARPAGAVGGVFEHRERLVGREVAAAQRHHADAGGDVFVEHHDGVLGEAPQNPVSHRAHAAQRVGNRDLFQRDVRVIRTVFVRTSLRGCEKSQPREDLASLRAIMRQAAT